MIKAELAEHVPELRRQHGGNLLSYGCGELARYPARYGLVDEIRFWVHPVVWGSGERLFHAGEPVPMCLTGTTMFRAGVTLCYEPRCAEWPQRRR